ncbi:MAG: zinc-ribbon and DUF3426 domain-containing protein [Pseudomonadales bacterium]|nr:zinc-ribbon and DUF3426 domain-containing protein [Pseudomonadales bacterium]
MNVIGITRCPQCQMSFHVTDEQLCMAHGAVRCGSCLSIFQAEAYMEDDYHLKEEAQAEPLSNLDNDGETPSGVTAEESLGAASEGPKESLKEAPVDVADSILDEVIYLVYDKAKVLKRPQDGVSIAAYWEAFELYAVCLQPPVEAGEQHWQGPPELVDPDLLVGEYEPDVGSSLYWFTGALALIVVGILQYLYFNFDRYAADVQYRQYALEFCQSLGCEVSEYSDAEFLATGELAIRTHPSVSGALIVAAIVQNTGIFRQRFPDITLRFVNPQGTLVAARTFSPGDYLAGEFRGLRYIPANTEVRFALEIVDPGEMAVGYDLSLVVR